MAHVEKFMDKRFSVTYRDMLEKIMVIIENYAQQGLDLSLRQLYYQLVARDLFPETWVSKTTGSKNCVENYKRLVGLVGDGREAGIIPWDSIVDRNRSNMMASTWDSPVDMLDTAVASYREDLWADQPWHIHMMVEKDALSGVLWPVCRRWGVKFTANKGYSSLSMLYWSAKEFQQLISHGKRVLLLYMGDHDPSGIDMTRDVEQRIRTFGRIHGDQLVVKRLALNYDQVEKYDPPENFVKDTDSRSGAYYDQYGDTCWELDALEPTVIRDLLEDEVNSVVDSQLWERAKSREADNRGRLKSIAEHVRNIGIDEAVSVLKVTDEIQNEEDDYDDEDE